MSAEPKRFRTSEGWARWEGLVVKGIFPLRRFLGGSEQGAVFLSEYSAGKASDAAIKLVPVGSQAEARLAHWRMAAALSHPNLVRLFDMGRCQVEGREFLFVVMEYGEQTLAQYLAQRTLASDEVRALLLPTLEAVAFLHSNQLAHARLKPSNFLVVNDQLKLASDTVRSFGHRGISSADDVWSLGLTLVEAFTQRTPVSPDDQDEVSSLLANIPAQFANTVRRCLHPNAANRPTVEELQTQFKSAPEEDVTSEDRTHAHPVLLAIPATLLIVVAALINPQTSDQPEADVQPSDAPASASAPAPAPAPASASAPTRARAPTPAPAPAASIAKPAETRAQPKATRTVSETLRPVAREVIPDVPQDLLDKIQGRILVTVRVLVDPSGNVIAAMMEKAGPNKNLANLADAAAREWKFAPAERETNRVWILTFAFTNDGATARATAI